METDFSRNIAGGLEKLLQGPKNPEQEFVRSGASFGQVYAMAAWLHEALSGPEYKGRAVCLAAEDKAIVAAALLATLAGGPSLLLPYAFSSKALARMQQETGFRAAISDVARDFPAGVQVFCPQQEKSATFSADSASPSMPHTELLKIFTGGTTGAPQVWSKTGSNIFGEGFFLARRFAITEQDCILATIPAYHIYGLLFTVVLPLVASVTVVGDTPSFPMEIARTAREQQASLLASVPAHYRVLRQTELGVPLRLAFSSAGMLDAGDNQGFCDQNRVGIVEVYGSTETGGIATRNRSLGEEAFSPFTTVDWKIVKGRLAVRSPYISPDLAVDDESYFTSGDRVEARGERGFVLQGRADAVTKVGGKRVDLEEIRLLINNQPGVADCAVMALPETGGREHQIGVLIQGPMVETDKIRKALADSLEPYALPRRIKKVDLIPVKKNGKYDWLKIGRMLQA